MNLSQMALLLALLVTVFWLVGAHHRLARHRREVASAWAQVQQQLQRRAQALAPLLRALQGTLTTERAAVDAAQQALAGVDAAAQAMHQRPLAQASAPPLVAALAQLDSTLARLLALLDQHPELRALPPVAQTLADLGDVDQRLAFARQLYNDTAARHDAAVSEFPTTLAATALRFARLGRL